MIPTTRGRPGCSSGHARSRLREESGTVRIVGGLGRTAARVGDYIRLSRAAVTHSQAREQGLITGLSENCEGPSFLVGDEITVFDPKNEATELRLSDPDVLFLRQKTVIAVNRVFQLAAGVGELVLDGQCLRLKGSSTTILWPAGFTPHVEDGVVQIRNGAGQTIVRVGGRHSRWWRILQEQVQRMSWRSVPYPPASKSCRMPRSISPSGTRR